MPAIDNINLSMTQVQSPSSTLAKAIMYSNKTNVRAVCKWKKCKCLIHWEGKVVMELSLNGVSRISLGKQAEMDPSQKRQSCER